MHGEREKICFENLINFLFPNNSGNQESITDTKCLFGLTEENRREFCKIIKNAIPNSNASLFPDFIFDDGFIEHFSITSSTENRKGAQQKKIDFEFDAKVEKECAIFEEECNQEPSYDHVRSMNWTAPNATHSYDNLLKSFKDNWQHHIESYNKYSGNKKIGIFMIDNAEFALAMCENMYAEWINGMSCGDYKDAEKHHCHRLSRDKALLEFCYSYHKQIKYVIYHYNHGFEIINLEHIPYLLKMLPYDYLIQPMHCEKNHAVYCIPIPIAEGLQDDEV